MYHDNNQLVKNPHCLDLFKGPNGPIKHCFHNEKNTAIDNNDNASEKYMVSICQFSIKLRPTQPCSIKSYLVVMIMLTQRKNINRFLDVYYIVKGNSTDK